MPGLGMDSLVSESAPSIAERQATEKVLREISGIGPGIARHLALNGITIHDIAAWTDEDIDQVDEHVVRIKNHGAESWAGQAQAYLKRLAEVAEMTLPPKQQAKQPEPEPEEEEYEEDDEPIPSPGLKKRYRLDRNRKFSEVVGSFPEAPGAAYMQDNRYFNGAGIEVLPPDADEDDYALEDDHRLTPQTMMKTIDLRAWMDGEVSYPFPMVRKALRDRTGKSFASQASARAYLRGGGDRGGF